MPKKLYKLLSTEQIFKGRIVRLVRDQYTYTPAPKEPVTRITLMHPGAVVILPFVSPDKIVLIQQFRWAARKDLWEIPAGTLEKKERPLVCAKRELAEETGYRAKNWRFLTCFYPAPGISNERMWLYHASGLSKGQTQFDHDEWIKMRLFSVKQALKMIRSGAIQDGKTIAGILWSTQLRQ